MTAREDDAMFHSPQNTGASRLPLSGIRVIEFSHMVMGPSCGMILGDLGADVIKIEPAPSGDNTRRLTGPAVGFFPAFNRNKRSLCVDLKSPDGLALVRRLAADADVLVENFRPGGMAKMGLGLETLQANNPGLIYCSLKGFLPGPYEHRAALDEVVQMMGGLAYMTGPPGRPLRAGSSVNDIMGGLFGALAVVAALRERDRTGRGGLVQSGLFETNMVLVAQHMARTAVDGRDPTPFGDPAMKKPWPLYDIFDTADDGQVFVGVVTETQWRSFCEAFGLDDLAQDPTLAGMAALAAARPRILPRVGAVFAALTKAELMARCETLGLPFSPINRPGDLFDDPHLLASGGLLPTDLTRARDDTAFRPAAESAGLPGLPISLFDGRPGLTRQPPRVGEHGRDIAREAGLDEAEVAALIEAGILVAPEVSAREPA
ncbi:Succinyl-CoA--L-malate CoA-transferase beta subunit [Methylobacterium crusticola]|uniref:Succinyl-CoA--L-malate CoA-transferase beta subunit n=1 Tax=Methylobacterium crusticola TaxID=1697972 RepID=A0ABQ4RAW4_9HYPH|nr:CaiB/BaiF CoA-transferase family protein [Methylobacterium crusticola]GJD54010.1 Succinyl-CoA--L-malate CoA-transferase beta subunit [Methylobacterium crusticola]